MAGPGVSPLRAPAGLGGAWARNPLLAGGDQKVYSMRDVLEAGAMR